MEKVLVGLSGGVDSAATALTLKERGYEVYGVYLSFCPGGDLEGAKVVAKNLGIPLYISHREKSFQKKVIEPFVGSFKNGLTPNPCVECNRKMKFASLLSVADRLGIEKVATGHYARIFSENGRMVLCRGKDESKDQSYFLWKLTQKQLSRILFPLAEEEKSNVKERAALLVSPEKKESMEICFVPDGDTQSFVVNNGGDTPAGDFLSTDGRILGQHKGISNYTIGQRRGLGISASERLFVTDIYEDKVVLGTQEELYVTSLFVKGLHFVSCTKKDLPETGILFQGRNHGKPIPCKIFFEKKGAVVHFFQPVKKYAPGQSACFYHGERLLLGGEIAENREKNTMCKV